MTQTLQPRYALAHVDAAGAHLDDFGGGRDSTQQRHRGGGLQREVVDSEDALFTPISSAAWVISRRVLAIFSADGPH